MFENDVGMIDHTGQVIIQEIHVGLSQDQLDHKERQRTAISRQCAARVIQHAEGHCMPRAVDQTNDDTNCREETPGLIYW